MQKCGLILMEDAVKTVAKVGLKKSHFELPLKETETVFGGLFICRIVQWLGRECVCDGVTEIVSVMKLSGSKEPPPPTFHAPSRVGSCTAAIQSCIFR